MKLTYRGNKHLPWWFNHCVKCSHCASEYSLDKLDDSVSHDSIRAQFKCSICNNIFLITKSDLDKCPNRSSYGTEDFKRDLSRWEEHGGRTESEMLSNAHYRDDPNEYAGMETT